jgi:hypothetical protein
MEILINAGLYGERNFRIGMFLTVLIMCPQTFLPQNIFIPHGMLTPRFSLEGVKKDETVTIIYSCYCCAVCCSNSNEQFLGQRR